jgi:hypothetical protein
VRRRIRGEHRDCGKHDQLDVIPHCFASLRSIRWRFPQLRAESGPVAQVRLWLGAVRETLIQVKCA